MKRKEIIKATVVFAIALAFIMPGATAFANSATIGVTSNSENTGDMEIIIENTIDNSYSDILETTEDPEEITDISDETDDDDTDPLPATGNTIYVDDNNTAGPWDGTWEHPYQYIRDGISNAVAGDSVRIFNGLYYEPNYLTIDKQLDIAGESRENVILNGKSSYNKGCIYIASDNVNISRLTVVNTGSYQVIYVQSYNYINIVDCFINQVKKSYDAVYVKTCSNVNIINCEIINGKDLMEIYQCSYVNIINCVVHDSGGYGIIINMPINPTNIIGCTVYNTYNSGIAVKYYYYAVDTFLLQDCTVYSATSGHGIMLDGAPEGEVINCTAHDNKYAGISVANTDYVNLVNCTTYNNTQEGIEMGTGYNDPENDNITGCTVYGNSVGIYLDAIGIILTGNTMYGNGCNLDISGDPYEYNIDPTNTVSGKPVYYLIEEENLTLDETYNFGYLGLVGCNNVTAENAVAEGVVVAYTTNVTLSNITVSGAYTGFYFYGGSNAKIEKCTAPGNSKYGFYIYYTDNVEITDCTVTNMLASDADAFYIRGSPGVSITDCIAHDVGLSYGFNVYDCPNANVINCQAINGGPTYATGMALYGSPYTNIIDCVVDHFQRGFDLRSASTFVNLINCTAANMTYCGFELRSSDCNLVNCTVYNSEGFFFYNNPRNNLTNCKSYNNRYGAYFYYAAENNLVNCEFYDNSVNALDIHSASYGNTFTNCKLYNHTSLLDSYGNPIGYGVLIEDNSYGTILTDCDVYNNNYGVYIYNSPNNILRNTAISNSTHSFDVIGSVITDFYQDIDTSNTINGKPIYYLIDEENMTIDETTDAGIGYLRMLSCNNMTVKNLDIPDLMLIQTTNSTLSNLEIHGGKNGIYLWESPDNDITSCTVYDNTGYGIYLRDSPTSDLAGCTVYNNTGHGIYLGNAPNSDLASCTVYNNTGYGIYLGNSPNSDLAGCTVYDNNYGIYLSASPNNILRDNTLTGNTVGFGITGVATADFYQDIDGSNRINGMPMYYLVGDSGTTINETHTFGYLILVACDDMTLQNLDVGDLLIILTTNSTLSNIEAHDGEDGIYLWESSYNDIVGCTVYNHTGYGIYLRDSHNNNVTDCTLYSNSNGIYLSGSSDNTIERCDSYNNGNGFYLLSSSNNNIKECNAYSNTHGIYLSGSSGNTIERCDTYGNSNYGFYLKSASNSNSIVDCSSHNNNYGFYLDHISSCVIEKCDIYDNSAYGIYANYLLNSNIIECNIHNDGSYGIYLKYSDNCIIEKCDISDNTHGIYAYYSDYNIYKECYIHGNSNGVYYYYGVVGNTIVNCTIYNNGGYGIYLRKTSGTKNNKAYHNTLASNANNAYSYYTTNKWDNGYPSGGNYWDDYAGVDNFSGPSQNITGSDGIGDTPYVSGRITDRYPLMTPKQPTPPPVAENIIATPAIQKPSDPVNITCNVTDYVVEVDTVKVNISGPEGFTLEEPMSMNGSSYWYEDNVYAIMGVYYYYIWANNTLGSEGISDTYSFVISDLDKPTSAVDPLPSWTNDIPFTVTATAFDNTGVENVTLWSRYSSNETDWTNWTAYVTDEGEPWSWAFTGSEGDGYYEFYSIAIDDYENIEEPPNASDASCGLDTVPPITTIQPNGTMGGDGWYIGSVTFTLSAMDELSGIESTWYKIDSGYWRFYTGGAITVSGDGRHMVYYYSFDNAGNREDTNTREIKIDTTAPTTTHKFDGMMHNEWYIEDVTVTLTANDRPPVELSLFEKILERLGILSVDTSGVNYTMYKIDDGEWTNYTEPFMITEDGEYIIYYYSIDFAGNREDTQEATLKIDHDEEPPETEHEFDGVMGENDWYISDVTVTLTATDNAAGVNFTMYRIDDDGAWEQYTGAFRVTEDGEHTLEYFSVDYIGNEEPINGPFDFKIDKTLPEIINFTAEEAGFMKWLLIATVTDETSGINRVEFYVDDTYIDEVTEHPYELVYSGTGHYAQVIVYDNAGHQSISESVQGQNQQYQQSQSITQVKTQSR